MKRISRFLLTALPVVCALSVSTVSASIRDVDPANGQQLAANTLSAQGGSCASCHGDNGNPTADAGVPRLAGQWAVYLQRQMRAYQLTARAEEQAHQGLVALQESDLKDLAAWYAKQTAEVVASQQPADDELMALGLTLYQSGSAEQGIVPCQVCHGSEGEGKQYLSYPVLQGQEQSYLALQLERFRDGSRAGWEESYLGNIMHAISKPLTDQDIEALAQYINRMP